VGIRNHDLNVLAAEDNSCLGPRRHCNRRLSRLPIINCHDMKKLICIYQKEERLLFVSPLKSCSQDGPSVRLFCRVVSDIIRHYYIIYELIFNNNIICMYLCIYNIFFFNLILFAICTRSFSKLCINVYSAM
jgi:hypothetical protein